jgi:hypothetical protein
VALQLPRNALERIALALKRGGNGAQLRVLRLQPPRLHKQLVLRLQRAAVEWGAAAAAAAAAAPRGARVSSRQRTLQLPHRRAPLLQRHLQLLNLALQRSGPLPLAVQQKTELVVILRKGVRGTRHAVQLRQARHLRSHVLRFRHWAVAAHLP